MSLHIQLQPSSGLNTGVLLIRNTEWSRQLLAQWAALGVGWPSEGATQPVNTTLQKVLTNL